MNIGSLYSRSSRWRQWIVRVMSFRNMYGYVGLWSIGSDLHKRVFSVKVGVNTKSQVKRAGTLSRSGTQMTGLDTMKTSSSRCLKFNCEIVINFVLIKLSDSGHELYLKTPLISVHFLHTFLKVIIFTINCNGNNDTDQFDVWRGWYH